VPARRKPGRQTSRGNRQESRNSEGGKAAGAESLRPRAIATSASMSVGAKRAEEPHGRMWWSRATGSWPPVMRAAARVAGEERKLFVSSEGEPSLRADQGCEQSQPAARSNTLKAKATLRRRAKGHEGSAKPIVARPSGDNTLKGGQTPGELASAPLVIATRRSRNFGRRYAPSM
jgi:hypothetical protein